MPYPDLIFIKIPLQVSWRRDQIRLGLSQKKYCRTPHVGKKGKDKFHACVIKALNMVRMEHLHKFSAKAH